MSVPAPEYQRIVQVLADRSRSREGAMSCRRLAAAAGPDVVPAKIEGVRSKAKHLVA